MKTNPFAAGAFLVASLAICALFGWGYHQKQLREAAEALVTQTQVELEGARQAILVAPKEIIKYVPSTPTAVKEAVKKGRMTPILGGKVVATSDTIAIPCPEPTANTSSNAPPPAEAPRFANVQFGLTGEVFVGKIKGGPVETTATLKGTVFSDWGYNAAVNFKPENVALDVVFSKDVSKAIEEYEQPWIKKHTALMCPGVGVTYNPLDTGRPVNVGVTCSYGFVWF